MAIFYLSFAGAAGWLGCIHTRANTFAEAVAKTHRLGINPGGEVAGLEIPAASFAEPQGRIVLQLLDRLLSREEMEAAFHDLDGGKVVKMFDDDGNLASP